MCNKNQCPGCTGQITMKTILEQEKICQKLAEILPACLGCQQSSPRNSEIRSHQAKIFEQWKIQKEANKVFLKSLALLPIGNLVESKVESSQNSALEDLKSVLADLESLHFQVYQYYIHSSENLDSFGVLIETGESYIREIQNLINLKSKGRK